MNPILNQLTYSFSRIFDFYKWCDSFSGLIQKSNWKKLDLIRSPFFRSTSCKMAFDGFTIPDFDHPCCILLNSQIWTRIHEEKESLQSPMASCCLQFWRNRIKCLDGRRGKIYSALHSFVLIFISDFQLLNCGLKCNYNFICQLVDRSDNEYEVRVSIFKDINCLNILINCSFMSTDSWCNLVVLLFQADRIYGYIFLHFTKENISINLPSYLPSFDHVPLLVGWS